MEKKVKAKGNLRISNEVVCKIAEIAATEIGGVLCENVGDGTTSRLVGKLQPPVQVSVKNETAEIDISIITKQGYKAVNVAEAVQKNIKASVQNMTGIAVSKVNVRITGIEIKNTDDE